jgi:23S rRNA (guanosine2251-2'-O)-methyltransferase
LGFSQKDFQSTHKILPLPNEKMKHRKLKNSELDRKSPEEFKSAAKSPLIIILDDIRSLNNIGSVFRTADAFLVEKIFLCGITATPPHKDITKTALGATESVAWEYAKNVRDVIIDLQSQGVEIIAIEQAEGATSLLNLQLTAGKKYGVVFGNEVKGVAQEVVSKSNLVVEIPQYGTKHSLNIAVSAGVVVWEMFRKLQSLS